MPTPAGNSRRAPTKDGPARQAALAAGLRRQPSRPDGLQRQQSRADALLRQQTRAEALVRAAARAAAAKALEVNNVPITVKSQQEQMMCIAAGLVQGVDALLNGRRYAGGQDEDEDPLGDGEPKPWWQSETTENLNADIIASSGVDGREKLQIIADKAQEAVAKEVHVRTQAFKHAGGRYSVINQPVSEVEETTGPDGRRRSLRGTGIARLAGMPSWVGGESKSPVPMSPLGSNGTGTPSSQDSGDDAPGHQEENEDLDIFLDYSRQEIADACEETDEHYRMLQVHKAQARANELLRNVRVDEREQILEDVNAWFRRQRHVAAESAKFMSQLEASSEADMRILDLAREDVNMRVGDKEINGLLSLNSFAQKISRAKAGSKHPSELGNDKKSLRTLQAVLAAQMRASRKRAAAKHRLKGHDFLSTVDNDDLSSDSDAGGTASNPSGGRKTGTKQSMVSCLLEIIAEQQEQLAALGTHEAMARKKLQTLQDSLKLVSLYREERNLGKEQSGKAASIATQRRSLEAENSAAKDLVDNIKRELMGDRGQQRLAHGLFPQKNNRSLRPGDAAARRRSSATMFTDEDIETLKGMETQLRGLDEEVSALTRMALNTKAAAHIAGALEAFGMLETEDGKRLSTSPNPHRKMLRPHDAAQRSESRAPVATGGLDGSHSPGFPASASPAPDLPRSRGRGPGASAPLDAQANSSAEILLNLTAVAAGRRAPEGDTAAEAERLVAIATAGGAMLAKLKTKRDELLALASRLDDVQSESHSLASVGMAASEGADAGSVAADSDVNGGERLVSGAGGAPARQGQSAAGADAAPVVGRAAVASAGRASSKADLGEDNEDTDAAANEKLAALKGEAARLRLEAGDLEARRNAMSEMLSKLRQQQAAAAAAAEAAAAAAPGDTAAVERALRLKLTLAEINKQVVQAREHADEAHVAAEAVFESISAAMETEGDETEDDRPADADAEELDDDDDDLDLVALTGVAQAAASAAVSAASLPAPSLAPVSRATPVSPASLTSPSPLKTQRRSVSVASGVAGMPPTAGEKATSAASDPNSTSNAASPTVGRSKESGVQETASESQELMSPTSSAPASPRKRRSPRKNSRILISKSTNNEEEEEVRKMKTDIDELHELQRERERYEQEVARLERQILAAKKSGDNKEALLEMMKQVSSEPQVPKSEQPNAALKKAVAKRQTELNKLRQQWRSAKDAERQADANRRQAAFKAPGGSSLQQADSSAAQELLQQVASAAAPAPGDWFGSVAAALASKRDADAAGHPGANNGRQVGRPQPLNAHQAATDRAARAFVGLGLQSKARTGRRNSGPKFGVETKEDQEARMRATATAGDKTDEDDTAFRMASVHRLISSMNENKTGGIAARLTQRRRSSHSQASNDLRSLISKAAMSAAENLDRVGGAFHSAAGRSTSVTPSPSRSPVPPNGEVLSNRASEPSVPPLQNSGRPTLGEAPTQLVTASSQSSPDAGAAAAVKRAADRIRLMTGLSGANVPSTDQRRSTVKHKPRDMMSGIRRLAAGDDPP